MAIIRSLALKAYAKIFELAGAQTVTEVELGPAIPVIDTSRMAMYGAGLGAFQGYWVFTRDLQKTGAGQTIETAALYSDANELGVLVQSQFKAWLMDVWATADEAVATEFSNISVGLVRANNLNADAAAGTVVPQLVYESSQLGVSVSSNWGSSGAQPCVPNLNLLARPVPIEFPGNFIFAMVTSGAGLVDGRINCLIWVGPNGALPPIG